MTEHAHTPGTQPAGGEEFWDDRYRGSDRVWSGNPNAVLVREVEGTPPGRALDLGCGEGADAVWLARQGWQVTGADISGVALQRAAGHAAEAGVADRVEWQRHDFAASFPTGRFDLVSACFLHTYGEFPRPRVLRAAAAAVAPGGILLVAGHAGSPSWDPDAHPGLVLPTPDEVLEQLQLAGDDWEVLVVEEHVRPAQAPDGTCGSRPDNLVKLRRLR
ncbi:SAM-dependent methyltransferase [Streptomyces sp. cmx-4-9]|uniref:SAM-dependent methyltransferase n=1 Tax=Streptomyces sp. cmx-4-9 TaxID=2790941 RepID=UPI00397F9E3F